MSANSAKSQTPNNLRRRVQRIEDWDDARYAVTPPRAVLDKRLTQIHFRLMTWLGKVNTRQGWCEMSQTAFAELTGLNRGAVNRAIGELVKWQYIQRRGQKASRSARCHYRLLVDDPTLPEACHAARDTSTCDLLGDTGVTSGATDVSPHIATHLDQRSKSPPLPPKGGRERSGWARGWTKSAIAEVELLRASAPDALIVECVIDQVRGTLPPKRNADPVAFVRDVANRLRPFARDVLEATGAMLADTRTDYLPAGNEIEKIARTCERRLAVTAQKPEAAAAKAVDPVLVSRFAEVRAAMRVDDIVLQDWIDKLIPISIAGKVLNLLAPTRFHASWVQSNYERELLEAARAVLDVTRVKFVDHQT